MRSKPPLKKLKPWLKNAVKLNLRNDEERVLSHYNFKQARAYSYDDAFADMLELYLPYQDIEQLFRCRVFNVVARNQGDHTKNISFLLPECGEWRLSPACV